MFCCIISSTYAAIANDSITSVAPEYGHQAETESTITGISVGIMALVIVSIICVIIGRGKHNRINDEGIGFSGCIVLILCLLLAFFLCI